MATNTPEPDQRPAPVPWLQALGILATVALVWIDATNDGFDPPREIYLLLGAAIIGLGPTDAYQLLREWRRK